MEFLNIVYNKKSNEKDITKKKKKKKDILNIIKPSNKKLKLNFDILNPDQDEKMKKN